MLPLVLDPARIATILVGSGPGVLRRLQLLEEAGARHVVVFAPDAAANLEETAGARLRKGLPEAADFAGAQLVFLTGLALGEARRLAAMARHAGALVHAEDQPAITDLHSPSVLRRGDLTVAVSTGGRSPGLARRVRVYLEGLFGGEWQGRIDELAGQRASWREAGAGLAEVARWTDDWIDRRGWLRDERLRDRNAA
jgi:precorrin-2 dehydrogenase/sirohydrochlorin ferrochelatase